MKKKSLCLAIVLYAGVWIVAFGQDGSSTAEILTNDKVITMVALAQLPADLKQNGMKIHSDQKPPAIRGHFSLG